jgi:hypothetical protein
MTKYVKCDQCVAAGNSSKKDVFVVVDENKKVSLRCSHHGGKGKAFIKPLDEHYPTAEEK